MHLLSRRCPSPGLPPFDGLPPAVDLLVHMAGDTAEKREAVRHSGGVCHDGDADGSRAHELQADGAASLGPESEGEKKSNCAICHYVNCHHYINNLHLHMAFILKDFLFCFGL